eukprot:2372065-Amphidinium_carterae.2
MARHVAQVSMPLQVHLSDGEHAQKGRWGVGQEFIQSQWYHRIVTILLGRVRLMALHPPRSGGTAAPQRALASNPQLHIAKTG